MRAEKRKTLRRRGQGVVHGEPRLSDGACRTEVTSGTVARILGLPVHEIERLCEEGKLRGRRIGDRGWWRIEYGSVLEFAGLKADGSK